MQVVGLRNNLTHVPTCYFPDSPGTTCGKTAKKNNTQASMQSLKRAMFPVQEPHMSRVTCPRQGAAEKEGNSQEEGEMTASPKELGKKNHPHN